MNTEYPPAVSQTLVTQPIVRWFPSLCWGAIIGGTIAAIGIQILLSLLGLGAGLSAFTPTTDAEATKHFSEGAAAIWTGGALVALFFGSLIAGRFSESLHNGFVHGILVWCVTLIITVFLFLTGVGTFLGGTLKIVGEGMSVGGKAVASGMGDIMKDGTKRTGAELDSFIAEAKQSVPTNAAPKAITRAQREVGLAVTKLFATDDDMASSTNRSALIKKLMDYTQASEVDSTKTVDDWITSYKNLQADLASVQVAAEQKAKKAAAEAGDALSTAGIWSFFALLIGLLVSAGGGVLGADYAVRHIKARNVKIIQPTIN